MTPVSFVKTTETYVKTTESYEFCIIEKDRNGPNNRIGPDCAGRAQLQ